MRRALLVLALVLAVAGCAAPPEGGPQGEPVAPPAPPPPERRVAAAGALGDLGAATAAAGRGVAAETDRPPLGEPLYRRGRELYAARDWEGAAEALIEFYDTSPRSRQAEDALFLIAEARFNAGQYATAYKDYEALLKAFPSTDRYPTAVERQFQIGKLFVEGKARRASVFLGVALSDVDLGIEMLDKFSKQRDTHPLAPEALFLIGEARLRQNDGELAIEVWQRLIKGYPEKPWARLAEYNTALAFLSLSAGVHYDKRPILVGLRRLRAYVRKYETGDKKAEASAKLAALEEELARHDLAIAERYAQDDQWVAARVYLESVRREYPKTDAAREAERHGREWPNPAPPPPPDPK